MFESIIPLLSVILGSFITLLGVYFTNKNALKQIDKNFRNNEIINKRQMLQQKGEALYKDINDWHSKIRGLYFNAISIYQRKLSIEETTKEIYSYSDKSQDNHHNIYRIEMYIKAYFPSLTELYADTINKRDKLMKYIFNNKNKLPNNRKPIDELIDAIDLFKDSMEKLKSELIKEITLL